MRYALGTDVDTKRHSRTKVNRAGCHHILLRTLGLLLLLGGASAFHLYGIEKHWIAHEAQVIVVGTFKPNPTYPWFDGWDLTGTTNVIEVLGPRPTSLGLPPTGHLLFRRPCRTLGRAHGR